MRRISSALISLTLIAQPISAFAFYQTPGELVQALQFDPNAKTFNGEIHVSNDTLFVSAWMKGMMQGSTVTDLKLSTDATVDIEDTTSHMKGRFKGSLIIADSQVFVKVDAIQGTFEDDALLTNVNFAIKRWVSIPIDADMLAQIQQQVLDQTAASATMADQVYDFHHTPYQYGNSYTLTLKPDALATLMEQNQMSLFSPSSESLVVKVDTNYKDEVQVQQMTFNMSFEGFTLTAESKAQKMQHPLKVSAPTDAVTVDWLMQHLDSLGAAASLLDGLNMQDVLPPEDQSSSSDDSSSYTSPFSTIVPSSGSEGTSTGRRRVTPPVKIINRVNPGITKPSRRMLEQQGNTNRK